MIRTQLNCEIYDACAEIVGITNNSPINIHVSYSQRAVYASIKKKDYLDYLLVYIDALVYNFKGVPFSFVENILFKGENFSKENPSTLLTKIQESSDESFEIIVIYNNADLLVNCLDNIVVFTLK